MFLFQASKTKPAAPKTEENPMDSRLYNDLLQKPEYKEIRDRFSSLSKSSKQEVVALYDSLQKKKVDNPLYWTSTFLDKEPSKTIFGVIDIKSYPTVAEHYNLNYLQMLSMVELALAAKKDSYFASQISAYDKKRGNDDLRLFMGSKPSELGSPLEPSIMRYLLTSLNTALSNQDATNMSPNFNRLADLAEKSFQKIYGSKSNGPETLFGTIKEKPIAGAILPG